MRRLKYRCEDDGVVIVVASLVRSLLGKKDPREILYIIWSDGVVIVVPSLVRGLPGRKDQRDILYIIWSGELFFFEFTWLPVGYLVC